MSADTGAAIILNTPPSPRSGSGDSNNQGRPEIGKDFYINEAFNEAECASSLSSISGGGIPNLDKVEFGSLPGDIEEARNQLFEVEASNTNEYTNNTTEDNKSSLSSLTNDFFRKGRFATFGRLRNFQVQISELPVSDDEEKNNMPSGSDGNPWYTVESKRSLTQSKNDGIKLLSDPTGSTGSPSSEEVAAVNVVPDEDFFTSKKHLDELVCFPPPPPPPPPSSTPSPSLTGRASADRDDSLLSHYIRSDSTTITVGRGDGFANYVFTEYHRASPRRRKMAVFSVVVIFLVCIIAMVLAASNIKPSEVNENQGATSSYHDIETLDEGQVIYIGGEYNTSLLFDDQSNSSSPTSYEFAPNNLFSPGGEALPGTETSSTSSALDDNVALVSTPSEASESSQVTASVSPPITPDPAIHQELPHEPAETSPNSELYVTTASQVTSSTVLSMLHESTTESKQESTSTELSYITSGQSANTTSSSTLLQTTHATHGPTQGNWIGSGASSNNASQLATESTVSLTLPQMILEPSQSPLTSEIPSNSKSITTSTPSTQTETTTETAAETTAETTQVSTAVEASSANSSGQLETTATPLSTQSQTSVASLNGQTTTDNPSTHLFVEPTKDPTVQATLNPAQQITPDPSPASPATTPGSTSAVIVSSNPSTLFLKPSADTTIFKNRPTNSYADQSYLSVKGLNRASSFLRFDVSTISEKYVGKAVLRLYSILPDTVEDINVEVGGLSNIVVDMLPFAGGWDETSVTYNNPVLLNESFRVGSFSVEGYPYTTSEVNKIQRLHEVDVTTAFPQSSTSEGFTTVSFRLYSDEDSTGRVDFASSDWNHGFAEAELLIELSDTSRPTKSPTTKHPTTSPTVTSSSSPSMTRLTSTTSSPTTSLPTTSSPTASSPTTSSPTTSSPTTSSPTTYSPTTLSLAAQCKLGCDEEATKRFQREFGSGSVAQWIDVCLKTTRGCKKDDKKCEKECKKDAEKAEKDALKKVDKHTSRCNEKCIDAGAPIAVERHPKNHKPRSYKGN